MTTTTNRQLWTTGPAAATRCTEAVLMQFGIFGVVPETGGGVLQALTEHGFSYQQVTVEVEDTWAWEPGTLVERPWTGTVAQFCREHPTGRYYFFTPGHALALIDGLLVDTAGRGPNRSRVDGAYRVWRREPEAGTATEATR